MPASKQPRKRKAPAAAAPPTPPAPPTPEPAAPIQTARVHSGPLSDEILTHAELRPTSGPARPADAPPASLPAYLRREPDAPLQANRAGSSAANRERMRDALYLLTGVDPTPTKPSS